MILCLIGLKFSKNAPRFNYFNQNDKLYDLGGVC